MKHRLSILRPANQALTALFLLAVIGVAVYIQSFRAPFIFDDLPNITENPLIRMTEITPDALARVLKSRAVNRPLANLSYAVNYFFHGYDVRGYHLVNLVIHIITAFLIFLIARQTLGFCGAENRWTPLLAAGLWLVNPLHTQSVTYIVQRMNAMAAMFFLLALYLYIRARITIRSGRRRFSGGLLLFLCLMAAVAGLAAKEIVAILPVVIFLYEWFFLQDLDRAWIKKQLPWIGLVVLVFSVLALLYMDGSPLEKLHNMYEKRGFTPGQRLLTEANVVIYYISLLVFPHPGRLILDYDFPLSQTPADPFCTGLAMAALLMLFVWAAYAARKHRLFSFAVFWFLITLAIESSVVALALIFEHRTYLPSVFPVIALTALLLRTIRPGTLAGTILCLAIAVCGFWTYQRNTLWQNPIDFCQDNVAKSPQQVRAYVNLGAVFHTIGKKEQAITWCQKALRVSPENAGANYLLGKIFLGQNRPDKALPCFHNAVKLEPYVLQYNHYLGVALEENGHIQQAARIFTGIIDQFPCAPSSLFHLARIYARRKNFDKAVALYEQAVSCQPDYVDAYNDLGIIRLMQEKTPEAISAFEKAVAIDPGYKNSHWNLALILKNNAPEKALMHAAKTAFLVPKDPKPLIMAGELLAGMGKTGEAIVYYEKATALQPDNARLLYNLACLYARQNNRQAAIDTLRQAINNGYNDWGHLSGDKDLESIRDMDYFKSLSQAFGH